MPTSVHRKSHKKRSATYSINLKKKRAKDQEAQKKAFMENLQKMYDSKEKHEQEQTNNPTIIDATENVENVILDENTEQVVLDENTKQVVEQPNIDTNIDI
jgi:hypothetical protein